jgi:hypothetical protein
MILSLSIAIVTICAPLGAIDAAFKTYIEKSPARCGEYPNQGNAIYLRNGDPSHRYRSTVRFTPAPGSQYPSADRVYTVNAGEKKSIGCDGGIWSHEVVGEELLQ